MPNLWLSTTDRKRQCSKLRFPPKIANGDAPPFMAFAVAPHIWGEIILLRYKKKREKKCCYPTDPSEGRYIATESFLVLSEGRFIYTSYRKLPIVLSECWYIATPVTELLHKLQKASAHSQLSLHPCMWKNIQVLCSVPGQLKMRKIC